MHEPRQLISLVQKKKKKKKKAIKDILGIITRT